MTTGQTNQQDDTTFDSVGGGEETDSPEGEDDDREPYSGGRVLVLSESF